MLGAARLAVERHEARAVVVEAEEVGAVRLELRHLVRAERGHVRPKALHRVGVVMHTGEAVDRVGIPS